LGERHLGSNIQIIVCDVSFISLKLALPKALGMAEEGAQLVALIKPQFEAGKDAVGKGGIVGDPEVHEKVCREIVTFLEGEGWRVMGVTASPVEGGDGNREFLVGAAKG
jgi:23S rRNA (cytidine1920-2'-O)/16S rRNA (cytidine1409-2'-O)-methyltransferase